jgi:uncharacterized membrane protein
MRLSALALALVGAGITAYLTIEHGRGAAPVCAIGHGCQVVAASAYARVGAVPTAALGLLMYLLLALSQGMLMLDPPPYVSLRIRQFAAALAVVGTGFSAWLTYVEFAVLHAFCLWCTASAVTVALLAVIAVWDALRLSRHSHGSPPDAHAAITRRVRA